jgi:23S rRNA (adenine2503-C2)-methyltransferase
MTSIYDLDFEELSESIIDLGIKPFVATQILGWLYCKNEPDIKQWSNISKKNQELISNKFNTELNSIVKIEKDSTGTKKFLISLRDGLLIEAVLIKESEHYTFCISSQVGCPLKCAFCATGKMGFYRDLTSGEILNQIIILKRELGDYKRKLNLVFMGMGEPLLNYGNLKKAMLIITSEKGLNISQKNITVSTSGFLKRITQLEHDFPKLKISFSLNSSSQKSRENLMPVSKKEPIAPILKYFKTKKRAHRVTFEYVMIKGINDSVDDAVLLSKLIYGIPCKVNIIPYNENKSINFKSPIPKKVDKFSDILYKKGYTVTIRWSKGKEINSACGHLSADNDCNLNANK